VTLDLINPDIVARADAIGRAFVDARPFPHVVLDDFLEPSVASDLLSVFPAFERGNSIGDDGRQGHKATLARIRGLGPAYARFDDAIQSPDFLAALGRMTGMSSLLYDPFYLGGGTHENRDGAALDPHVDFNYHPSERWHRRLNLLLYLNREWRPEWGGSLQLFADPRRDAAPVVSVVPMFNRCVIFETSERSWHAFDRIRLPPDRAHHTRKSVALYFYTRERPAAEVAERHSTVYVQRGLPERLVEGYALKADDVDELRALVAARDAQIDRQQAENTRLLRAQERGFAGQVLYLMKRAYVRFRR
jgi:hypothetical protein